MEQQMVVNGSPSAAGVQALGQRLNLVDVAERDRALEPGRNAGAPLGIPEREVVSGAGGGSPAPRDESHAQVNLEHREE